MRRIGIVNRGEPAVRFLATLEAMAWTPGGAPASVALYTDQDADALFVRRADHARRIGAGRAAYLDAPTVVAALLEAECDAAWLGWGFASEDAEFAAALEAAGITLLAPRPETMALLGDKIRAKQLAEACDVPVAPWAIVDSAEAAEAAASAVGLPLLVKAAGGGGGRGIRRVDHLSEVGAAFIAARDEAARSFRSQGVMLERLVEPARHIEVQVLGDGEGNVQVLGLRDCSLQRRRQKVIEEAPAPVLPEASARRLMGAAHRLCTAARYRSAGTVEFLYDPSTDTACFLEVNTRLQVEHPVTEAIYGVDLVRAQIEVALGLPLPEVAAPRGWAVEARVCAEDPHQGFAPAPGRIVRFVPPTGPGLRVDTGFAEGDVISPEFDALVAKIIAWGPDRPTAFARLARALEQTRLIIEGGTHNLAWLRDLLDAPAVRAGTPDITLVDRLILGPPPGAWVAALAAAIDRFLVEGDRRGGGPDRHRVEVGEALTVYRTGPERFRVVAEAGTLDVERRVASESEVVLTVGDARHRVERAPGDDTYLVDGVSHRVAVDRGGALVAPSASLVLSLPVAVGDRVEAGACVALVESMKMEVRVVAPQAGRVRELRVAEGEQVAAGQVLVVVAPEGEAVATASPLAAAPWGTTDGGPPADRLVAGLVGWDRDPAQTVVDRARLTAEGAPAVLAAFADIAELFERRPAQRAALDGAADAVSAGLWLETLRRRGPDALSAERRRAVARALAHHGVTDLAAVDLRDPLRRLDRAGRGIQAQTSVALDALAAVAAGVDGPAPVELLDRLADLDPARFGAVAEAADQTRYVCYERPAFERLCRLGDVRAGALLERLRSGRADWTALVAAPEALLAGMAPQAIAGCPVAAEAVARRLEWQTPSEPVRPVTVGGQPGFAVGAAGALRWVVTTTPEAAPALIRAAAEGDVPLVRLDVVVAGAGAPDALVDACVAALGLGAEDGPVVPWQTLCLAAVGDATLPAVRCYAGWGPEIAAWRDLLPATAQRLQLDRLAAFEVDRRPASDEVVLLRAKAHVNPDDVRLLAHGEIRSLARGKGEGLHMPHVERVLHAAVRAIQTERAALDPRKRMHWNRITLHVLPVVPVPVETLYDYIARLAPAAVRVGLEKVLVRARFADPDAPGGVSPLTDLAISRPGGQLSLHTAEASDEPLEPHTDYETRVVAARRRGLSHPHEWVALLEAGGPGVPTGRFTEHDLDAAGALAPVERAPGGNVAALVVGVLRSAGLPPRVMLLSDATRAMGALAEPECARVIAALDLAEALGAPVEWVAVSAGARIDMRTGTENLDWTARVLRRIVTFTQAGGELDVIVPGVCVGAQAYWNAEATMMMHTRGLLIMTDRGSMVLTGKRALDFSGCVSAEDDLALGGYTTIMGPNGQAQAYAPDLLAAWRLMARYRRLTAVHPGERRPRRLDTVDPAHRDITHAPYPADLGHGFERVGDLFSAAHNPDRKRPFAVRPVMQAVMDADVRPLERWGGLRDAETAVVWETRIGGYATCLIGIENRPVGRLGAPTQQGPDTLAGGTLYPQAARKIARALNAASGRRPAVVLANLSGFDGSPESLARWQLEYGAEIGRAVVNFDGPIVFVVLSRYHGGAYVVFSKALNPQLKAVALEGSFASVIGGAPAAAVVFAREVRQRAQAAGGGAEAHARATAEVAAAFDGVHTVQRAQAVGSIDDLVSASALRPYIIAQLRADHEGAPPT